MSARPVSVASDGDCMANTKENLDETKHKKESNVAVYQVVAKPRTYLCVC